MTTEFYRWKEYSWHAADRDWRKAETITAGVDVGAVGSKAAVMVDGELFCYSNLRTGSDSPNSAVKAMAAALEGSGMKLEDIQYIVGTGYGRVNVPFAQRAITEIACHARGAHFINPSVRTILDIGGQDCKAIHCDERGKVVQFVMNDKCAAGTGRGMEVMADLMAIPISEIGPLSLTVETEPPPLTSICVVFARTEAVNLLGEGWTKPKVMAAYCKAMAIRVYTLIERIGIMKEFAITGGMAKNIGLVTQLEKETKVKPVEIKPDPQIVGALGAALFARDLLLKLRRKQ